MATNPFVNSTKALPKSDSMIVRVPMDELEIGGRKSNLPSEMKSSKMSIDHVSRSGNGSGG